MNNLPERVFIDEYYKENKRTTYPACITKDNQGDVEYIRKDVAEEMAKELAIQLSYRFKHTCGKSPEQIVDEFLNSRK